MSFIIGVDLGDRRDNTGISVMEHIEILGRKKTLPGSEAFIMEDDRIRFEQHLRNLEKVPLDTGYPEVIKKVKTKMNHPLLVEQGAELVVDMTGVGVPVLQFMKKSGLQPIGVMIHSGNVVKKTEYGYNVPKRDIVAALTWAFESRTLKIPKGIDCLEDLINQLQNFKMKITKKGNDIYEADREEDHDDLVIAIGLPVWYLQVKYGLGRKVISEKTRYADSKPYDPFGDL